MARVRNYAAEYARRIDHGVSRGFSVSQSRGHAREAKGERSVTEAKRVAERYELPINQVAKIPKTTKLEKFSVSKTLHLTQHATSYNPSEVQRMIDLGGPNYVGTSIRVRLKNGLWYQSRVFGTASMGGRFYSGLRSKYGFSDDDVADIEYVNTETAA